MSDLRVTRGGAICEISPAELLGYSPGNDLSATHGRVRGEPR